MSAADHPSDSQTGLVDRLESSISRMSGVALFGRVTKVLGMLVEVGGLQKELSIGNICELRPDENRVIPCEVIGFREGSALVMPFGTLEGVGLGCRVMVRDSQPVVYPDESWLGRVINALGEPIDGKGPLGHGIEAIPLRNPPPPPHERQRLGPVLDLGVRVVNSFLSTCQGQRMGIFSGSGVGKSVLLSMFARYTTADVSVIGLVGERGREVQEFLEDDLGEEGLARSVVVVATSDEPPLMRRQAAYLTLSIAEYFRARNRQVLCLMDSVTRFAMAQREIGLSAGEPPTSKGYPPTTFAELARLLERAGPGRRGEGAITGIFSVLVEGDDHNEPISDAVRGIIDGHIVLDRAISDRGRYPAVNVLKSVSRSMPRCLDADQERVVRTARELIAAYEDMAELIRLGAYRRGSDPKVDKAIELFPAIDKFLAQDKEERTSLEEGYQQLASIIGVPYGQPEAPSGDPHPQDVPSPANMPPGGKSQ